MVYSQSGIVYSKGQWKKKLFAGVTALTLAGGVFASAHALTIVSGCNFDGSVAGTWSLTADCTTTGPINIPTNTTLQGNGHVISAGYSFGTNGDGTNTVIGVVDADNVTINNLIVDGTGGTALHGINVFSSTGVALNDVVIKNNDKTGLAVNSSTVVVNNLTTENNTWHGVNVDQRTTEPSSLTINGVSTHTDTLQVYVDDSTKQVTVVDTNNQYSVTNPQIAGRVNDRLYTLKPVVEGPTVVATKDECKSGGWMNVLRQDGSTFKNQGQCVAYVQSNENSKHYR